MVEPNESKSARGRKPYPPEMKERSVRLMLEHQSDYPTRMAATRSTRSDRWSGCGPDRTYVRSSRNGVKIVR